MANRLVPYEGGFLVADTGNTANAAVVRDGSGNVSVSKAAVTQLANTGGTSNGVTTYTTTATLDTTVTTAIGDATGAAFTLTLPPVATSAGVTYTVIKKDSTGNVVTVKGSGSENINGANTYTGLSAQYYIAKFFCDGVKWYAGKLS